MTPTPYRGGICASHGAVEINEHARCVLCGQEAELLDSVGKRLARARALDMAHEAALAEDSARAVIASEAVQWPPQAYTRRAS